MLFETTTDVTFLLLISLFSGVEAAHCCVSVAVFEHQRLLLPSSSNEPVSFAGEDAALQHLL